VSTTVTSVRVANPLLLQRRASAALAIISLVALGYFYYQATPYFGLDEATYGPYWWARRWPLLLHVFGGSVALLFGPAQLWLGLTGASFEWHRRLGITYVASVAVSSCAAYYLAFTTGLGWVFGAGLIGLATAWVTTTGLAFVAVRRGALEQHREWMVRSYVVTTGFITYRLIAYVLATFQIGTRVEQRGMASWCCWAFPLLITEAVIQGNKILRPVDSRFRISPQGAISSAIESTDSRVLT
jgi:uncharacterized membrane protein